MLAFTGASGFIGTNFAKFLISKNLPFKYLGRKQLSFLPEDSFVFCDFRNISSNDLSKQLKGISSFVHLGSLLPQALPFDHSSLSAFLNINAISTLQLYEIFTESSTGKFVFVSSANHMSPSSGLISEFSSYTTEFLRSPAYQISKITAEMALMNISKIQLNASILRLPTVYGYGMNYNFLAKVVHSLMQLKPVTINDDGRWSADMMFVGDVVDALFQMSLESKALVFNIGTGSLTSISDFSIEFCSSMDIDVSLLNFLPSESEILPFSLPPVSPENFSFLTGRLPMSLKSGVSAFASQINHA